MVLQTKRGIVEVATAVWLYFVYEVIRGFGGDDMDTALKHTADVVAVEQWLHIYTEKGVQSASMAVPTLPFVLGVAYITFHFVGTTAFLVWIHRRHSNAFAVVRTTIVVATGLALIGYLTYPLAPPRLAGLGFDDAVSTHTGLNLSSDLLGALYNPIAAMPSLHAGYAIVVGVGVAVLARRRWVRILGAAYPVIMLWVIVATGNHFWADAAGGAAVVLVGYAVTWVLFSAKSGSRRASETQPRILAGAP